MRSRNRTTGNPSFCIDKRDEHWKANNIEQIRTPTLWVVSMFVISVKSVIPITWKKSSQILHEKKPIKFSMKKIQPDFFIYLYTHRLLEYTRIYISYGWYISGHTFRDHNNFIFRFREKSWDLSELSRSADDHLKVGWSLEMNNREVVNTSLIVRFNDNALFRSFTDILGLQL